MLNNPLGFTDPSGFDPWFLEREDKLPDAQEWARFLPPNQPKASFSFGGVGRGSVYTNFYFVSQVAHAPALPGWGAGAVAGEGLLDGIFAGLGRLLGPLGLALVPSSLGDDSIFSVFRAVSQNELTDIQARGGQFAFEPGQMEVKQFAISLTDARYYRDEVIGKLSDVSNYSIVQTVVTGETWKRLEKLPLDFPPSGAPAVVVTRDTLPAVNADARKFGIRKVD